MDEVDWTALSEYVPITVVRMYPHLPWDREMLSRNKGITLDDTLYLDMPNATGRWDTSWLTVMIPIADQIDNPDLDWEWHDRWDGCEPLGMNSSVTPDIARQYGLTVDWGAVSGIIDMELVRRNPHLSWYLRYLSRNPGITVYDVMGLRLPRAQRPWDWFLLSRYLPMWQIRLYPDLPYDKGGLSLNPGLQMRDLRNGAYPNATGEWDTGSIASAMAMSEIVKHMDAGEGYPILSRFYLSTNGDMTMEYVRLLSGHHSNIQDHWSWYHLSMVVPMDDVLDNLGRPWSRAGLSRNPTITMSAIEDIDTYAMDNLAHRIGGDWDWPRIYRYVPSTDILRHYGIIPIP